MGNRRVILFLLAGICVCALLLWAAQRRARFFPSESKVRATLLTHPLDSLESVVVERGDVRVELRRRAGRWDMHAPFPSRADQGAVARLIDTFENARVSDAISSQELRRRELSLKELGLSSALASVVFCGPQWQTVVRVGSPTPLGQEVYVRVDDLDQVLVASADLGAVLPRSADDLRSRKLVHGDRASVRTLELRSPGRPFIKLSKETGTWRLVQPAAAPASDARVEAVLDALLGARVARFVWPTAATAMSVSDADSALKSRMELYGLGSDAALQVSLQEGGSSVSARLLFGRPLDDSDALRYALLQGGDTVVAVSNDVVNALSLKPSDLRDTRLFFDRPDSVRRLEVRFGDVLFALAQTNDVWRLQAPVEDRADQRAVRETVERLLRVNADSVTEDAQETQRLSAETAPPISYVELVAEQSAYRFTIAPDDVEGTSYRVTFTNTPAVFHVASSNVPPALVSLIGLLGLHDKAVLELSADSVRRITVKRQGGGAGETVRRDAGSLVWRLGEGMTGHVASERLGAWLACATALKADRIEKLGVALDDLDAYGLRSAWLEVSLDVDATDALRKTLLVGKEAGFGKRYAMLRGLDVVFVLDAESLRVLSSRLVDAL